MTPPIALPVLDELVRQAVRILVLVPTSDGAACSAAPTPMASMYATN